MVVRVQGLLQKLEPAGALSVDLDAAAEAHSVLQQCTKWSHVEDVLHSRVDGRELGISCGGTSLNDLALMVLNAWQLKPAMKMSGVS
jgi:hypothetical protein